jgi:hypothetical protein
MEEHRMELIVNDTRMRPPSELVTWGDVLDWLETQHLKAGQCITRVEFEGHEEIHYRKPTVCDKDIEALGAIRIESGEFDTVVRESFAELETELRAALTTTREIIQRFEDRDEEGAYDHLAQLLDSVRIFYSLFSEDLGWADSTEAERIQQTAALENAIKQLITAQENHFWVSVCDVLEYELTPVLEAWLSTAEKTCARVH